MSIYRGDLWPNFKDLNYPSLLSFAQAMTYRVLKNYVAILDTHVVAAARIVTGFDYSVYLNVAISVRS